MQVEGADEEEVEEEEEEEEEDEEWSRASKFSSTALAFA